MLLRYTGDGYDHIVLFNEFINYDPSNGEPEPGVTRFNVYEAALGPHKVVESEYLLTELIAEEEYFMGKNQDTDEVKLKRISYCDPNSCEEDGGYEDGGYSPRTNIDLTPLDVVLVIDKSGSMSGEKMTQAKEAAKIFVDLMKPGDKIGIVAFSDAENQVYPSQVSFQKIVAIQKRQS